MNIIFTFKELNTFLCHITPSFLLMDWNCF
uniref:Uncharacterized protein n=1 Tax=Podoviridae sp. ctJDl18 TaxID=2825242 RepID=A0A8S5V0H6_9CAUD|nr:MAG TPA: hypothetical protein [Podoviridae sp. ctJDl18]